MKQRKEITWHDVYSFWEVVSSYFPELREKPRMRSVEFSEPKYGPCSYYNWVPKGTEEEKIQEDLERLASTWSCVGEEWNKGAIWTAAVLTQCETDEERAAVWLAGFARAVYSLGGEINETQRCAYAIESEAMKIIGGKYGYWHTKSKDVFPGFYFPLHLFLENKELSAFSLVELAAENAALVLARYTPVEYNMARK